MAQPNNLSQARIFLSGGGDKESSQLLDREFIKLIKKGVDKKLLYLPIAMNCDALGYERCFDWISDVFSDSGNIFIDIEMWIDLEGKTFNLLEKFDGIYIGGGNTFFLLDKLRESGFAELLVTYINSGKPVYGGSAGAIILGQNINIVSEENQHRSTNHQGLSCLGDYSVICHYQENDREKIQKFIAEYRSPVIAIHEDSGLFLEGNTAQIIGFSSVNIFHINEVEPVIFEPGSRFEIKEQ